MSLVQALSSRTPVKPPAVSVREVRCATLVHKLNYMGSTCYTANLYKGCSHGCSYCYAPSLTHDERRWGTYVDAKVNAPSVMERELRNLPMEEVFLSSASDPYQPVEGRYRLTRKCLSVLQRKGFPVSILTRSPLVLRDLDLLRELPSVRVGMSITSVPNRVFEPGVPPLERRIDTLAKLAKAGTTTYVSLAPVIPGLIMVDLDKLFRDLSEAGVSWVYFGILRFDGYAESKALFESVSGMNLAEALQGREEIVRELSALVKDYGMEPRDSMSAWKPDVKEPVLMDSFF